MTATRSQPRTRHDDRDRDDHRLKWRWSSLRSGERRASLRSGGGGGGGGGGARSGSRPSGETQPRRGLTGRIPGLADLPHAARRVIVVVAAAAAALSLIALRIDAGGWSGQTLAVLIVALLAAEALRIDLPYRRGGSARFSSSDAVVTAGLLILPATPVVIAAAVGLSLWQVGERVHPVKLVFNTAQYVAATSAAAIVMGLLAPRPGPLDAPVIAAVVAATALFLLVNVITVSAIITATAGTPFAQGFGPTLVRMTPTAALLAAGTACLGLLAAVLIDAHPWALPALIAPVLLLHSASRQAVRTKVDAERTDAYAEVEQRLSEATDPTAVARELAAGVGLILGCNAAVWRQGQWLTPVPPGSQSCPVDPDVADIVRSRDRGLGPAVSGPCDAVGLGGGVMVVWSGELALSDDADRWLERLGRSARVHLDRAAAAVDLAQERETLRAVVDGTGDGIYVLDSAGVLRLVNPAMVSLAALPSRDVVGRPVAEVLGEGPWDTVGVHDVVRPGSERVWRVAVASVRDRDQGELRVAAVHDVSEERRVARMKDDMLAVVSHELRTPLTPIKASAQLLRRRWERLHDGQREGLLMQVEQRADHLSRLVEDILVVAQMSDGSATGPAVRPVPTDLARHLRDTAALAVTTHPEHEIVLEAPGTLPGSSDPLRLRQVVDNLVDNACKFSPTGSTVRLTLAADGDDAVVTVADQGRGIAAEDLERIFERFERVEDPLVMSTSGAGLGLYIVRATVTALGGTVALDSTLGVGTTVTVRLPLGA